ncbi:3-oxoacyl-[acyl-carrier-protein] reductase FabG [Lactococcus lactis]|uniref:SDR family NAD(P)-dependent oxidoreductase n=1 Tax=Lactococcus lactis TaxID=1358 RepID=UPI000725E878|nr:SDR family NAD(P)-dependent oxidoreductase [Lactococcus lactis]KSU12597.1 Acetoacetyl-CoA reductase [Lactococcus lactis subsp. lactis]MDU0401367.1 3-oxoacyl-[acyl-carrier-protein] reductase FabG [Lactococcus lactis]
MNKRTILITGATRGIGWAIAQKAAQANHKVILTGRDPLSLKSRAEELQKKFPKTEIQAIPLDVSNRSSIANAAKLIKDIDILINNAGITADSTFKKMSPEIWDDVISVNLTGVFNSTHALLDKINQGGQIITLTSKSALFGNFGQANYAASKAGIIAFTKTLAKELKKSMIRVNSVSPAAVTDMTLPVLKSLKETYGQNIPDEWKMGSSSDVANFIINDLIETEMTGKIFSVNGSEIGYWQEPTFHKL